MKNKLNLIIAGLILFAAVLGCSSADTNTSTAKPASFTSTPSAAPYPTAPVVQGKQSRKKSKKAVESAAPDDLSQYITPKPKDDGMYHLGPRGGCYTYTSGGNKRYVDRSLCN